MSEFDRVVVAYVAGFLTSIFARALMDVLRIDDE